MEEADILAEIRKTVKKTVGMKKVQELMYAAKDSIGVGYGLGAAGMRLNWLLDELELLERQLVEVEQAMEAALCKTGYAEQILGIKRNWHCNGSIISGRGRRPATVSKRKADSQLRRLQPDGGQLWQEQKRYDHIQARSQATTQHTVPDGIYDGRQEC